MKRFIIALFILLTIPIIVYAAITWHDLDNPTVAWDATTITEGTLEYEVFLVDAQKVNPKNKPTVFMTVTENQVTFIVPDTIHYYLFGVRAVNTVDDVRLYSDIAWSDEPEYCRDKITFGFKTFPFKEDINNLHIEQ